MKVSAPESDDYIDLPINYENLVKHKYFVQEVDKIYWNHQFQRKATALWKKFTKKFLTMMGVQWLLMYWLEI